MEIKVSSKSNPKLVAGMITAMVKENKEIIIITIGAGAVNQAIKSVIIANGYLTQLGRKTKIEPFFQEIIIQEEKISAIKLKLIVEE